MKPKYQHDCKTCVFLGHVDGWDHYIHYSDAGRGSDTLIARDGNEPEENNAMPRFFYEQDAKRGFNNGSPLNTTLTLVRAKEATDE